MPWHCCELSVDGMNMSRPSPWITAVHLFITFHQPASATKLLINGNGDSEREGCIFDKENRSVWF